EQLALRRELAHGVIQIVRAVDSIVRSDGDAVRALEHAFAPRGEETPVPVEDDDGMHTAVEDVDAILRVDGDAGDFDERPTGRKMPPALGVFVAHLPLLFAPGGGGGAGAARRDARGNCPIQGPPAGAPRWPPPAPPHHYMDGTASTGTFSVRQVATICPH